MPIQWHEGVTSENFWQNITLQGAPFMDISLKKRSGIYKILDTESGKVYIGSAAKCLYRRYHQHFSDLKYGRHGNKHLQAIYNKRSSSLKFEVVEFCESANCITREQYYIDTLSPAININKLAQSRLGTKISQDTLVKMRNKKVSQETKNKIRKARESQVFTKEQLEYRASQVRKALFKKIKCSNGMEFNSVNEASRNLDIPTGSISRVLIGYTSFENTRHGLNFWYITTNAPNKQ